MVGSKGSGDELGRSGVSAFCRTFVGAPGRIRTSDTRFRKPMLYPLSYRRKARVVYRGEAGVATGVGQICLCSVPGVTRDLLLSRGRLAEAVTGPAAESRSGRGSLPSGTARGDGG